MARRELPDTERALALIAGGTAAKTAAQLCGVAPSTVFRALARRRAEQTGDNLTMAVNAVIRGTSPALAARDYRIDYETLVKAVSERDAKASNAALVQADAARQAELLAQAVADVLERNEWPQHAARARGIPLGALLRQIEQHRTASQSQTASSPGQDLTPA